MAAVSIMTPDEYVGAVMEICQDKRGIFQNMEYIETTRVVLHYKIPLNERLFTTFLISSNRAPADMPLWIMSFGAIRRAIW